jgi:two-component system nitrate/nitrite response regulator NarL
MHNIQTILVADDHPLLLKGLVDELESKGYNVIARSTNGLEALERLLSLRPDIAILDIQMPMLSGIEVITKAS